MRGTTPFAVQGGTGNVSLLEAEGSPWRLWMILSCRRKLELLGNYVLILYNDGVIEAINEQEQQFGHGRLIKLVSQSTNLPAPNVVDRIKREVTVFAQGQPEFDDSTLVILRQFE
jgi:sigma-B regulation protein RsbU (phosphoserine phosphatase)